MSTEPVAKIDGETSAQAQSNEPSQISSGRDSVHVTLVERIELDMPDDGKSADRQDCAEHEPTSPSSPSPSPKPASLTFIFISVFIDFIGLSLVIPILPYYGREIGVSATYIGILFGGFSFTQFISTAAAGIISDKIGRRPVILSMIIGSAIGLTWSALVPVTRDSFWMFFASRCFTGLFSGSASMLFMRYLLICRCGNSSNRGY